MNQPTSEPAPSFYDALAPLFDVMTDWEERLAGEMPFLLQELESIQARKVLDAACGSGGHALGLAALGYEVAGADASPRMIELARHKASATGITIPFVTAALDELPAHFAEPFDVVLCLGNSLPHLLGQSELIAALRGMASVLRPGGLLITQNLNYDLRWQKKPRFFNAQGGDLEGREVLVWRFADYDEPEGLIAFHIALFRKAPDGWNVQVHTTTQRPLFLADLAGGVGAAGFTAIRTYGHLALPEKPFDPGESPDLVLAAQKAHP